MTYEQFLASLSIGGISFTNAGKPFAGMVRRGWSCYISTGWKKHNGAKYESEDWWTDTMAEWRALYGGR